MNTPNENLSEYDQVVKDWRRVSEEWHQVMRRNMLTTTPPDEDLELAKLLGEEVDAVWEKLKELQKTMINRQRG